MKVRIAFFMIVHKLIERCIEESIGFYLIALDMFRCLRSAHCCCSMNSVEREGFRRRLKLLAREKDETLIR